MSEDESFCDGRPVKDCQICGATFSQGSVTCWRCEALRPKGVVQVTWAGCTREEQTLAREVLDSDLNTGNFFGRVTAELIRGPGGEWRIKSAVIETPDVENPQRHPTLTDGRSRITAALETGGLTVAA